MARTLTKSGITDWAMRLVPAAILGMAAPATFMADPGTVAVFTQLGAEPSGRLLTGGFETLAVILLLIPRAAIYGAILGAGLMTGALLSHLTVLGVAPGGDPSMFVMAAAAFLTSAFVIWRRRREIPLIGQFGRADEASVH